MISEMIKSAAALALTAGCLLAPAMVQAQAAPGGEAAAVEKVERTAAADGEAVGADKMANGAASAGAASKSKAEATITTTSNAESSGAVPVQKSPAEITASVKAAFEKEFPGISLDDVRPTPFAGIYELRIGSDLLYTNEQVEYVLQGTLIDARDKEDLTAKRIEELTRVAFDSLPLESAIKQVKGDGSRKIAVFEDPNCGYCKRLHQTLEGMDNYTVYTLLFPILSPDSTVKARNIWCAADRVQAWRDQMLKNQAPPDAQCETPIEANLAFGRKLLVRGTPAIIFEDGSRVNGALPRDALEQKLDEATAAVVAAAASKAD